MCGLANDSTSQHAVIIWINRRGYNLPISDQDVFRPLNHLTQEFSYKGRGSGAL